MHLHDEVALDTVVCVAAMLAKRSNAKEESALRYATTSLDLKKRFRKTRALEDAPGAGATCPRGGTSEGGWKDCETAVLLFIVASQAVCTRGWSVLHLPRVLQKP